MSRGSHDLFALIDESSQYKTQLIRLDPTNFLFGYYAH